MSCLPLYLLLSASQEEWEDEGQCACFQHTDDHDPGLLFVYSSGWGLGTRHNHPWHPRIRRMQAHRLEFDRQPTTSLSVLGLGLSLLASIRMWFSAKSTQKMSVGTFPAPGTFSKPGWATTTNTYNWIRLGAGERAAVNQRGYPHYHHVVLPYKFIWYFR